MLSAIAAIALLFAANAPASAAMSMAKPDATKAAVDGQIIKVRCGFRHRRYHRHRGWRRRGWHRRGRWHRRSSRHGRWHHS